MKQTKSLTTKNSKKYQSESVKLISPDFFYKRSQDYISYLDLFRKDYLRFGLYKELSGFLFRAGLFSYLSRVPSRAFFLDGFRVHKSFLSFGGLFVPVIGRRVIRFIMKRFL